MIHIEWETIDDSLFDEAGTGECVQVSSEKEYMTEMHEQNKKVVAYLREKYPNRLFRVSKWHSHDFGQYQEVEEGVVYDDDNEDEE